ncbi:hypothetical protein MRX96_003028 [Rhipicephalus microplus]
MIGGVAQTWTLPGLVFADDLVLLAERSSDLQSPIFFRVTTREIRVATDVDTCGEPETTPGYNHVFLGGAPHTRRERDRPTMEGVRDAKAECGQNSGLDELVQSAQIKMSAPQRLSATSRMERDLI